MSEFGNPSAEILTEAVRASENAKEETWRERFLAENLFHNSHIDQFITTSEDKIQLLRLEHEFLEEKRHKNMGERFDLAISPKYLGKIHVVELGTTSHPGLNGEVDGLKSEFRDLLRWMQLNGLVDDELPRSDGTQKYRSVSVRQPELTEAADKLVIMVRNRKLIDTAIEHNARTIDVAIAKRMVFSLPRQSLKPLLAINQDLNDEGVQQFIEEKFLKDGWGGVRPIRTAYYLATYVRT